MKSPSFEGLFISFHFPYVIIVRNGEIYDETRFPV